MQSRGLLIDALVQELIQHIRNLLWLMIVLNFSDGLQCVLTGVLQVQCHTIIPFGLLKLFFHEQDALQCIFTI